MTTVLDKTGDQSGSLSGLPGMHISEAKYEDLVQGKPIKCRMLKRPEAGTLYALRCGFVPPEIVEVIFSEMDDPGSSELPPSYAVVFMQTERSRRETRRRLPVVYTRLNPIPGEESE